VTRRERRDTTRGSKTGIVGRKQTKTEIKWKGRK